MQAAASNVKEISKGPSFREICLILQILLQLLAAVLCRDPDRVETRLVDWVIPKRWFGIQTCPTISYQKGITSWWFQIVTLFLQESRTGMLDWNDPVIFFGMGGWWLNHQTEFLDLPRLWIGWPKSPGQWRLRCSALLPLSAGPTPLCGENHLPALCGGWGRHHPRVIGMISGNIDIWSHGFLVQPNL